ncbi:MAG: bifunctional folylpolyglutamate synthase/dihydrofolate synthase [Thermoplasmata archaeon]|nr:bifunctional folylpolyglutamate synthase/dihydrofolate synthase [Thermoplasmata archaeon]MCI4359895.1 bifunctional folylpolyglutamate synthase/dihydrofolate synthase [Thermoplasmata archaeon]
MTTLDPSRSAPSDSGSYRAALDELYSLRRFGMRPGLEGIRALLEGLGHPERSFRAIHVAGSKGKGSVSAMAAQILQASGRTVGLYTSPHLVSYRERIRVNGRPIPRRAVTEGVARVQVASRRLVAEGRSDRPATFFEVTTALALDWFRQRHVEDAVIEVGIGGRLDATNVLDAPVGVITTIELEHTDVLGPTLSDIAREKAGILHRGMRSVVGALPPEARTVVDRTADSLGVPVWHLDEEVRTGERTISESGQRFAIAMPATSYPGVEIPLHGRFQAGNAAIAVAAVQLYQRALGRTLAEASVRSGLAAVHWRGRLEAVRRRPWTYLDVAHTPDSARAVTESLAEIHPFVDPAESVILFGCLSDKRSDRLLEALSPIAQTVVVTPIRSERSADPNELRRRAIGSFRRVVQASDVSSGFALAKASVGPEGILLVVGSDYLVGEVLEGLEGRPEDEPDLSDPGRAASEPPIAAGATPGRRARDGVA